jgi:signal transduction histidine kinase
VSLKPRILLVEDYAPFTSTIEKLLAGEGYEVIVRVSGAAALSAFAEQHPDLVVLDLGLPDIDGLEVCYAIKQHPFARHIPVLVMTARREQDGLVRAFECGADDYLTKPVFLPGLLARVRAHLKSKTLFEEVEADRGTLQQILEITGNILSSSPDQDIFHELIHQLNLLFDAARVSIVLPDADGEWLRVVSTTDFPLVQELKVSVWKYPEVQKAMHTRDVVLIRDVLSDTLMAPVCSELEQAQVGSILVIPILSEDGAHGALLLKRTRSQDEFTDRDVWLCRLISQAVAALLRNHDLHKDLERNLKQLQETRDRLLQSEKLSSLGQFVAGIAHELNNPLTGIISFTQLLLKSHQSPFVRQSLGRIAQEAERCRRVVRNLLTFSRTHTAEKEPIDLNALIETMLEGRRNQFQMAQIRLATDLEPGLSAVLGNTHQFEQILSNLMDNALAALAHASVPPRLTITSRQQAGKVHLVFSDNGPGMRAEVRERIFEPFFTTKAAGSGTGLGMTIVKGIVEEHGGTIEVQSEPGQGASFLLGFPALVRSSLSIESFETTFRQGPNGDGRRILLVDDEAAILEALAGFLRMQQYEVHTATRGMEAVEACRQRHFDAVVLDLRLPDITGRELHEVLLQMDPALATHFVFTSGDGMTREMRPLIEKAEETFLAKPFTFDELTGVLEHALRIRSGG